MFRALVSAVRGRRRGRIPEGLTQQGCNWFKCAAAVARCIANPNPKQCILDIAPNCIDCL
jgi:hypothetical protein